jgi:hypothetical protein
MSKCFSLVTESRKPLRETGLPVCNREEVSNPIPLARNLMHILRILTVGTSSAPPTKIFVQVELAMNDR